MIVAVKVFGIFILQFLIGFAINQRLGHRARSSEVLGLSIMSGLGISSLVVFMLEVVRIPLGYTSIALSLLILACLFWKDYLKIWPVLFGKFKLPKFYEFLFFVPISFLVVISIWRCFYLPVTSFDSKAGVDLVAKYALLEGTIASTVFTEHLPNVWYWSNQPFYAPFTMIMQVIFRSTDLPFGKVWLSFLFVGFLIFFYGKLKARLHPILAGILLIMLLCIPEFYAYTFLIQTDFSNALFFVASVMFFHEYYISQDLDRPKLLLSILFMGLAVWTRSETIVMAPFGSLLILYKEFRNRPREAVSYSAAYLAFPLFLFIAWNFVYIKLYLPISPSTLSNINLGSDSYFVQMWNTFKGMVGIAISLDYWNYTVWVFLIVYVLNVLIFRSLKGSHPLLWVLVLFVLFLFMLQHIPGVGLGTTYRRGFFKFLPLFIFVLSQIPLVTWVSDRITNWESR